MNRYRMQFYSGAGSFQGREEFEAENDRVAMMVAELLRDACSDVCEGFELWDGARRVNDSFSKMPCPSVSAEYVSAVTQLSLLQREEAIQRSHSALARSKRLVEQIERLLAEHPR